ncbi:TlpA family protein disulfide reductase [Pseudolysobacter antarcticus]|uniref:TlpA family protein disulfide reductase n=1 Tax=Pseudolysobacter antarcticus TaxID=2511995 RepID=A0A411HNM3_9GAMM|nr:TlpA disulfide reductase family protein [Pseudolysobacter antarcticus]QBB72085.1 TlpA family protein disulfide reductase [Pseudolysobacter antarcticus]
MFNRTNLLIVAIALLGAGLGLFAGQWFEHVHEHAPTVPDGVHVLKLGDQRAELSLTDIDGRTRRLSEWDGKLVVINFWATWCSPCREEMPLLDQTRARFADKNLEVLGIAIDDRDAVRDFLKIRPVQYPILNSNSDSARDDPSLLFGDTRSVLPYSVLIGRDGKLLAQHAGSFSEDGLMQWLQPHLRD